MPVRVQMCMCTDLFHNMRHEVDAELYDVRAHLQENTAAYSGLPSGMRELHREVLLRDRDLVLPTGVLL